MSAGINIGLHLILLLGGFEGLAQQTLPATKEISISGAVKKETIIRIADLEKLKTYALGDVSILNHAGVKKSEEKNVKGVLLKDALAQVEFDVAGPKFLSEFYLAVIATDGYTVIFSWNEVFNSLLSEKIFIVTERDGKNIETMDDSILLLSTGDINTGRRHVKSVQRILVGRVAGLQKK